MAVTKFNKLNSVMWCSSIAIAIGALAHPSVALAQDASSAPSNSDLVPNAPSTADIIVTAEKRSERLMEVPVPVTALDAGTLVNTNQLRLQDFYSSVPGFSVTPRIGSQNVLAIRGITTGPGTNPTVGVTVDDVPYGSSTLLGGGLAVPDLDPGDLARVEVLRGPQGTLYGASSMGGLLKFVTVDPSTTSVSGSVQAGIDGVENGAQLGYNFRGSINLPVSSSVAVRVSGFTRQDPGYIDNPVLNINGLNEQHVSGGRISAIWRPSPTTSLKVAALYQRSVGDGSSDSQPYLGDLQQNYVRGAGHFVRTLQAYSATLSTKVGSVDLVSVTGYNVNAYRDSFDLTDALGDYTLNGLGTFPGFGVRGTTVPENIKNKKFSQEVRASGNITSSIDWTVGGFFTHESPTFKQDLLAVNETTGKTVGVWYTSSFPTTFTEYAAFADLTYHFTDRFDIQVGGRESHIRQSASQTYVGVYDPVFLGEPSPVIYPRTVSNSNAFTYLITPRFRINPDVMVYARISSGYRAGGSNAAPGVPKQYNPDRTQNYEVGVKAAVFDRALTIDASAYRIDWTDIQLNLTDPATYEGYIENGGAARSQGLELSVTAKPVSSLSVTAFVAYNDAKLTESLPAATSNVRGTAGDRLPYTSKISGNFAVDKQFDISTRVRGSVGGAISIVGSRKGLFASVSAPPERQDLPSYAKLDLHAGIDVGTWNLSVYANNVFDKRGILSGGIGETPPTSFLYIQPRTVGVNVTKRF